MVPSRYASEDEIVALCGVVKDHPGTTLEFIPCVGMFEEFAPDLLTRMSLAANRPVNWNVLFVGKGSEAITEHNLAASDYATERGARVLALTVPFSPSPRICFDSGFLLDTIPGWEKPMALPHDEKKAMLASPDGRDVLREAALQPTTGFKVSNWGIYVINETFAPENKQWEGKSVAEIAKARGVDEFDALCDIVVADDLMTGFGFPMRPDDDETWQVAHEGVARRSRRGRRERRRRAPRLPRDVQLLDGAARRSGARARAAADRRGDPPPHRRARAPLRPDRARPARRRAGTPTSSSSIPRRSARRRCGCGSTCRPARPASTAAPTASTT